MKNAVLVGNPNCGKTYIWNCFTGSFGRVANFPGITVEKKQGNTKNGYILTDLPGTYSLDGFSTEEKVASDYIKKGNFDLIINVADGTNLKRGLFLTLQLASLKKPMILIITMADIMRRKQISIDTKTLSRLLNIPVIAVSGRTGENIEKALNLFEKGEIPSYKESKNIYDDVSEILLLCGYTEKNSFCKADKILCSSKAGLVFLAGVLILVFGIVFSPPVFILSDMLEGFFSGFLTDIVKKHLTLLSVNPKIISFLCQGLIGGVGGVLSFLPQVGTLYILLTILEDSGYMARAIFITDKPFSKIGLSGRSLLPLLFGFGCTTSAFLSSRILQGEKSRLITIIALPFISCSAKMPIYLLFADQFFPAYREIVIFLLYLSGVFFFIFSACFFSGGTKKDFLTLELPSYKMPSLKNIIKESFIRIKGFIVKAGSIIFLSSALLWIMSNTYIKGESLINIGGNFFSFLFKPMGFGNSQATASLFSGFFAKEAVVSSLWVLTGKNGICGIFTTSSALAFLVFASLTPPCISALGVMKKEIGIKWTLFAFIYQLLIAYLSSAIIYTLCLLLKV